MHNGEELDAVQARAVEDAERTDDQFPDGNIVRFRRRFPKLRKATQVLHLLVDARNDALGVDGRLWLMKSAMSARFVTARSVQRSGNITRAGESVRGRG